MRAEASEWILTETMEPFSFGIREMEVQAQVLLQIHTADYRRSLRMKPGV